MTWLKVMITHKRPGGQVRDEKILHASAAETCASFVGRVVDQLKATMAAEGRSFPEDPLRAVAVRGAVLERDRLFIRALIAADAPIEAVLAAFNELAPQAKLEFSAYLPEVTLPAAYLPPRPIPPHTPGQRTSGVSS